jgi:UDP-2,4-diacetamido-2,4,6-trideoxy-beta-L-altropyranose hydrolase
MPNQVSVREITLEDRLALWEWRNDPTGRGLYKPNSAIAYQHHKKWFEHVMRNNDVLVFIGLVETLRIGCVRFDNINNGEYDTSVYLKPYYCGKEIGVSFLQGAIMLLKERAGVRKITARIKVVNPASAHLFEAVGFQTCAQKNVLLCELNCS